MNFHFTYGFEAEFCYKRRKKDFFEDLKNFYRNIKSKNHNHFPHISKSNYSYFCDKSIIPYNINETGVEIISPIFENRNKFFEEIFICFDFIKKNGYTNGSCGFHFSLGNFSLNFQQALNLVYKLEIKEKIHEKWQENRKKENVCYVNRENWRIIQEILFNIKWENVKEKFDDIDKLEKLVNNIHNTLIPFKEPFWKTKYANIAFNKQQYNFIEFRFCGGKNYENMSENIFTTIEKTEKVLQKILTEKNLKEENRIFIRTLAEKLNDCFYFVDEKISKVVFVNHDRKYHKIKKGLIEIE